MLNISISDTVYLISQVRTTVRPRRAPSRGASRHSDPDEMNFDQWPLTKPVVDDSAQRAPHRVPNHIIVAACRRWQRLNRVLNSVAKKLCGCGCCLLLDQPDQTDRGRCS